MKKLGRLLTDVLFIPEGSVVIVWGDFCEGVYLCQLTEGTEYYNIPKCFVEVLDESN